jgi:hypothetical protein
MPLLTNAVVFFFCLCIELAIIDFLLKCGNFALDIFFDKSWLRSTEILSHLETSVFLNPMNKKL